MSKWATNRITGLVEDVKPNANADLKMRWLSGYAMDADYYMKVCAFDDTTNCYKVKTVPRITTVDKSEGYVDGGSELTITGYGFNGDLSKVVFVDGVECTNVVHSGPFVDHTE